VIWSVQFWIKFKKRICWAMCAIRCDNVTVIIVYKLLMSKSCFPIWTVFCICEADILLSQMWPYCYRMLTHSHSATSLYNWANLSQSEISLHQLFISRPHLNLWTSVVWPRVYCKFFAIFTFWLQKYLDFGLFHHSTCDIIPKLSIN
jgi:hypothetical protein